MSGRGGLGLDNVLWDGIVLWSIILVIIVIYIIIF